MTVGKTRVALMDCEAYDTALLMNKINKAVALLGGFSQWIHPGMNVLLKVNLIGPMPPESAAVTHAEFVRAVVRLLQPLGCTVWIGDSSGGAIGGKAQTGRSFAVSGLEAVAQEEGAVIKNFDREGLVEVQTGSGVMHLAKPVFDADFVINLPKLKSHLLATYTGAVKNLYGCVPGQMKATYHKQAQSAREFGEVICAINKHVSPGLHILDGVVAMDGQGPTSGKPYAAGKILAAADPLALDAVAVRMLGRDIRELPLYAASVREHIGVSDLGRIEVFGDYDTPPRLLGFKLPRVMGAEKAPGNIFGRMIDLMRTRPVVDEAVCKRCNVCVESCPVEAIDKATKRIDYEACIGCMCCHEMCTYHAVKLVRANPLMRALSRPK